MDGGISFIRNRNYIVSAIKSTGQFSDEVLRSLAPTTKYTDGQNTKYINRGIINANKQNKNSY